MSNEVRSPHVFGRPLWSWAGALTSECYPHPTKRYPGGHPVPVLKRRCRAARRIQWPLCRWLTGHRQAAGERGYGGNGQIDVFCAYCYFPWQVPASEMPSASHLVELFHQEPTP